MVEPVTRVGEVTSSVSVKMVSKGHVVATESTRVQATLVCTTGTACRGKVAAQSSVAVKQAPYIDGDPTAASAHTVTKEHSARSGRERVRLTHASTAVSARTSLAARDTPVSQFRSAIQEGRHSGDSPFRVTH